jgi:hypothetical protein
LISYFQFEDQILDCFENEIFLKRNYINGIAIINLYWTLDFYFTLAVYDPFGVILACLMGFTNRGVVLIKNDSEMEALKIAIETGQRTVVF